MSLNNYFTEKSLIAFLSKLLPDFAHSIESFANFAKCNP